MSDPQRQPQGRRPGEGPTPDALMQRFAGRSLKAIIVFTVLAHALILTGSSIPFLWSAVFGPDAAKMDREERLEKAMVKVATSLRDIAEQYKLEPEDLSRELAGRPDPKAPAATDATSAGEGPAEDAGPRESSEESGGGDEPKSAMEERLDVKDDGPEMPPMDDSLF